MTEIAFAVSRLPSFFTFLATSFQGRDEDPEKTLCNQCLFFHLIRHSTSALCLQAKWPLCEAIFICLGCGREVCTGHDALLRSGF